MKTQRKWKRPEGTSYGTRRSWLMIKKTEYKKSHGTVPFNFGHSLDNEGNIFSYALEGIGTRIWTELSTTYFVLPVTLLVPDISKIQMYLQLYNVQYICRYIV
jgi:hypothetical protein